MKSKLVLAHISMFLVALFYASNFTIAKQVMPEYIQPFGFIVLRVIAASILFWISHTLFIREKVENKDMLWMALCAVFGVAVNQLMFFKGLNLTTPINGALIMLTTPILVLLISAVALKERITSLKVIGISLGVIGALVLIWGNSTSTVPNAPNPLLGNIFIGINAASYACYLILIKPLMAKYHPITILKWIFSIGLLYVLPFGLGEFRAIEWSTFSTNIWLAVIYVLVVVTFLAYLFNAAALKVVNPSVVGTYIYLQPLLAGTIAVLAGQDSITWRLVAAGALIFVGVYMVSYQKKETKPTLEEQG
ncbi:MAG: EamA family transporter [Aureispira sp.]|nr:EamA family transporter [Aureispira sp.]